LWHIPLSVDKMAVLKTLRVLSSCRDGCGYRLLSLQDDSDMSVWLRPRLRGHVLGESSAEQALFVMHTELVDRIKSVERNMRIVSLNHAKVRYS
jgi:hypothetical protein